MITGSYSSPNLSPRSSGPKSPQTVTETASRSSSPCATVTWSGKIACHVSVERFDTMVEVLKQSVWTLIGGFQRTRSSVRPLHAHAVCRNNHVRGAARRRAWTNESIFMTAARRSGFRSARAMSLAGSGRGLAGTWCSEPSARLPIVSFRNWCWLSLFGPGATAPPTWIWRALPGRHSPSTRLRVHERPCLGGAPIEVEWHLTATGPPAMLEDALRNG